MIVSWKATSSTKGVTMSQQQATTNTIAVTDDEFANGYQTGYFQYKTHDHTKPLTDMDLYALYVGTITSVYHSGRYYAGYLTGWTAALLGATSPTLVLASQHIEEVTV
jgi:hypothetical protein